MKTTDIPEAIDIASSAPVWCDSCNRFHMEHLWAYEDGTWSICDNDGNHEEADDDEANYFLDREKDRHLDYARYVAETGDDQCGEFSVTRKRNIKRKVRVVLTTWLGEKDHGVNIASVRLSGRPVDLSACPEGLARWLCLARKGGRWVSEGTTLQDVRETHPDDYRETEGGGLILDTFAEWAEARPDAAVIRDVRAAARRYLRTRRTLAASAE